MSKTQSAVYEKEHELLCLSCEEYLHINNEIKKLEARIKAVIGDNYDLFIKYDVMKNKKSMIEIELAYKVMKDKNDIT